MVNNTKQQYKLEMNKSKMESLFAETYSLRAEMIGGGMKEKLKKDVSVIKKLNKRYKHALKDLDKKIINVQNGEFKVLYAAQIQSIIPYIQMMGKAAKSVDEGEGDLAKAQAIPSIPKLEGTIEGIERILLQAVPIGNNNSKGKKR